MLTCRGARLADDEWSSPQQSNMLQVRSVRGDVSLTPRGLFFSQIEWIRWFVTLGNKGVHSHWRGGEVRDPGCGSHHHVKLQTKTEFCIDLLCCMRNIEVSLNDYFRFPLKSHTNTP